MSGLCMPDGGVNGVPGAVLNPPVPLPCRTVTWPVDPVALPHTSPQSALARSGSPSLLKSAVTNSLRLVVLVARVVAVELNVTSAPAGAAASRNRSAAQPRACRTGPPRVGAPLPRGLHPSQSPARWEGCHQGRHPD